MRGSNLLRAGFFALAIVSAPIAAQEPARFDWFEYRGDDRLPQPRASEYRNPILQGFYPDPSITRAGDDYYLVTSTFAWFPGIPVFHSRDLVNWTQVGHAIDRPDQLDFKTLALSRGVFAPTIEYHDGTFYILNTCVDCGGNFVITAEDPRGPWSDPVWLNHLKWGIDPSLFFDDDGRAWVLNNDEPPGESLYEGHRAIWIQEFDPRTLKTFGRRTMLVNGGVDISTKPIWIEGPHIQRKDGWYYLTAAEGGTAEGHSQVVLRSRRVTGPYRPFAGNPILTQRDLPRERARPITSAGHADLVQTQNGDWWATFLAVRPYQGDYYNTGREVFLMPVSWPRGGWPRITAPGETIPWTAKRPRLPKQPAPPVPTNGPFTVLDQFDSARLPLHWAMMRNPKAQWWRIAGGALELVPRETGLGGFGNPSFLARRQQHANAVATTSLRFKPTETTEAGIAALQNDEYWYSLGLGSESGKPVLRLRMRDGEASPAAGKLLRSEPIRLRPGETVQLRIEAKGSRYAFAWSLDGREWQTLLDNGDGTILSTKRAGGFVGTMIGPYAHQVQTGAQ